VTVEDVADSVPAAPVPVETGYQGPEDEGDESKE